MTSPAGLRLKTFLLLSLMVVFGPLGDVLLGKGMKRIGAPVGWAPTELLHFFVRAFASQTVWLGIASLLTFFLAYVCVLSWADYSYVMPAGAFGYAVQTVLAVVILHEVVSPQRWFGVVLIVGGVMLVGQTHPSTTPPKTVTP